MKNYEKIKIKKATTYAEQIELLINHGLTINNYSNAETILKNVGYYRLSAYMIPYKEDNRFIDGISIETIYGLYEFDKKFRNLLLGVLESIEIAFRSHISYILAHSYGATGYLNTSTFIDTAIHKDTICKLLSEIERSDEMFIRHHKVNYDGIFPVWVALEVASFGLISRIFSNLNNVDKKLISKTYYNLPHRYIKSWLYVLSTFRNRCAHHGRIYNKKLTIKPVLHKIDINCEIRNDQVFSIVYILKKLLINPLEWTEFVISLESLINSYDMVDIELMGFPKNWISILKENESKKV